MSKTQFTKTYETCQAPQEKTTAEQLWKKYAETHDIEIRNELLMLYVPLVKRVVSRLFQSTKAFNEYDDLISCGVIGLIDAMDRFNPTKGAAFETYAQIRIRGEVLDYMRSLDWAPVHMRLKIKKVESAFDELSQEKGRLVNDSEVADHLNMSLPELQEVLKESHFLNVVHLEELIQDTITEEHGFCKEDDTAEELEKSEFREHLKKEIGKLTEREQMVVSLYYTDELTLKEIGMVLNLTESRVCQIHSSVMAKLKGRMKSFR